MNDVFDALNAKCPVAGIYKNSPKIKVIKAGCIFIPALDYSL